MTRLDQRAAGAKAVAARLAVELECHWQQHGSMLPLTGTGRPRLAGPAGGNTGRQYAATGASGHVRGGGQ